MTRRLKGPFSIMLEPSRKLGINVVPLVPRLKFPPKGFDLSSSRSIRRRARSPRWGLKYGHYSCGGSAGRSPSS